MASGLSFVCYFNDCWSSWLVDLIYSSIGRIFCGWFCPQTIFMEMVSDVSNIGLMETEAQMRLERQNGMLKK